MFQPVIVAVRSAPIALELDALYLHHQRINVYRAGFELEVVIAGRLAREPELRRRCHGLNSSSRSVCLARKR